MSLRWSRGAVALRLLGRRVPGGRTDRRRRSVSCVRRRMSCRGRGGGGGAERKTRRRCNADHRAFERRLRHAARRHGGGRLRHRGLKRRRCGCTRRRLCCGRRPLRDRLIHHQHGPLELGGRCSLDVEPALAAGAGRFRIFRTAVRTEQDRLPRQAQSPCKRNESLSKLHARRGGSKRGATNLGGADGLNAAWGNRFAPWGPTEEKGTAEARTLDTVPAGQLGFARVATGHRPFLARQSAH